VIEPLPDIPRLLTGVAEWAACLVFVWPARRWRPWPFAAIMALALVVQVGLQLVVGEWPLALWVLGMVLAVAAMFAWIRLGARTTLANSVYLAAKAFVLAELVAAAHWQVHCFFFPARPPWSAFAPVALWLVAYPVLFAGAWLIESRRARAGQRFEAQARDLVIPLTLAAATFSLSNLSFMTTNTPFSGRLGPEVFYIRTLVDICGYAALYAWQSQRLQQQAKAELAAITSLLRSQHEQYLQSKRSMDAVNRAYHDLKHQIMVIRREADPARRESHIAELEQSIKGYQTVVKTGNEVVDVMVAAKGAACAERDIALTCVADGAAWAFVSVVDICTILGNALDNAIEAVAGLADPARRLVRLSLFTQNSFAVLKVENPFDGRLVFQDGELATSRADPEHHGFGLKSIRYVADRYGGSMTARPDGEWFVLSVLLPVPAGSPGG
jgi:hypothetical protein